MSSDPSSGAESGPVAGGLALDDDPLAEPIAAVSTALLAEIAGARNPLAAEMVLCGALRRWRPAFPTTRMRRERLEALALMLGLVDHLLGGGIKDCWVAEGHRGDDTSGWTATVELPVKQPEGDDVRGQHQGAGHQEAAAHPSRVKRPPASGNTL